MSFFSDTIDELPPTGAYAPDFVVLVNGEELDPESKGDVLSIKLMMSLTELNSAEITLNNWDDKAVWFKYSDRPSPFVGDAVVVKLGYAGEVVTLLNGEINSITPQFPADGSPTLRLGVLDLMNRLRNARPGEDARRQFTGMQYSEIAEEIGGRHGITVDATPDNVERSETLQGESDDAQFLQMLARRIGYDCYIRTDPDSGEPVLRFGPHTDGEDAPVDTEHSAAWGQGLISFEPTLSMSEQVAQVTVRGWNHDTMEEFVETATAADLPGGAQGSGAQNAAAGSGTSDVLINADVQTREEAAALARSTLINRSYAYATAKGEVVGMPRLRPGDAIRLSELGTRFSGTYHVTNVEHDLGSEGYRTRFDVEKPRDAEAEDAG